MIYKYVDLFFRAWNRLIISPLKMKELEYCGEDVFLGRGTRLIGAKNISIGNSVSIGENSVLMTTKAKIYIGNHVMTGPGITMISGDHRTDVVGKYMNAIKEVEKGDKYDKDIVLEGDNWLGANSTILKGVTIGYGAVVGAGSLVVKDIPPFSIVGGNPAKVIKMRFDEKTIHQLLQKKDNY